MVNRPKSNTKKNLSPLKTGMAILIAIIIIFLIKSFLFPSFKEGIKSLGLIKKEVRETVFLKNTEEQIFVLEPRTKMILRLEESGDDTFRFHFGFETLKGGSPVFKNLETGHSFSTYDPVWDEGLKIFEVKNDSDFQSIFKVEKSIVVITTNNNN
jgi:hypothetical protein